MRSYRGVLVAFAVCAIVIPSMACSREVPTAEGAFANELKAVPAVPVARTGVPDDGVKPVVKLAVVTKVGTNDDVIKPVVKPGVVTKVGANDDAIKPVAPAPAPTPR